MIKNLKKILRENHYLIFINFIERLFFFLIFLIIAREYTTEIFGKLITVFSLSNIILILFDLGLPILLQRQLAALKERFSELFSDIIIINFLLFPVYLLITFAFYIILYEDIAFDLFIITTITVYTFSIANILNRALSGINDFKNQFTSLIISRGIIFILFLAGIYFFKIDLYLLLLLLFLGALLQVYILIINLRSNNLKLTFVDFDLQKIKSILKNSLPLGLAVIFNFLYDKIDILLISKLTDFTQVSLYIVGYGIFKASTISFSFLFITGLTKISYLSKRKKAVNLFFKKYLVILTGISIGINLLLFFGAEFIIKLIYTDKFYNSIFILKILSFAIIGLSLNNLTGIIMNGLGLFKMNMIVTLLGLIINVILNFFFIPKYGIAAAAVITIVTEYFIFGGDYFCIKKFLKS